MAGFMRKRERNVYFHILMVTGDEGGEAHIGGMIPATSTSSSSSQSDGHRRFPPAAQPEVMRAAEKDDHYTSFVSEACRDAFCHLFGARIGARIAAAFHIEVTRTAVAYHNDVRLDSPLCTSARIAVAYHNEVTRVYYPGLASHPEHELAKRQMNGFGGVVSFEIDGDLLITAKFVDSLKIPYIAPSFGGVESIVDQPAIMSYWDLIPADRLKYGTKENLIRFSFGVENFRIWRLIFFRL